MKINEIVKWKGINKKGKEVLKTGIVLEVKPSGLTVKSGRKKYFVESSSVVS